jgi:hypothetical protein
MHFVKSVQYLSGYRVLLGFEDGSAKAVDLARYLDGEVFEPLRNPEYFKTVQVHPELQTVVWDNGADFSPDFLYAIGTDLPKPAGVG